MTPCGAPEGAPYHQREPGVEPNPNPNQNQNQNANLEANRRTAEPPNHSVTPPYWTSVTYRANFLPSFWTNAICLPESDHAGIMT
jgi:hypothetical protein